jgi:hypothetical protein
VFVESWCASTARSTGPDLDGRGAQAARLLKDLPAKLDEEIPTYFKEGVAGGIFPNDGGGESAARNDLEFYALSGTIKKPNAKIEDFWHLAPLKAALAKLK